MEKIWSKLIWCFAIVFTYWFIFGAVEHINTEVFISHRLHSSACKFWWLKRLKLNQESLKTFSNVHVLLRRGTCRACLEMKKYQKTRLGFHKIVTWSHNFHEVAKRFTLLSLFDVQLIGNISYKKHKTSIIGRFNPISYLTYPRSLVRISRGFVCTRIS